MDFMDWVSYFVFNPKDSRSKFYVEVYDGIVSILNLETRWSSSAAFSVVGPDSAVLLLRFAVLLLRSGLLEYWIRSYVWEHFFGCSLRPGMPLNSPCKLASSVLSWSSTLPIKAQRQSWLPRPYARPSSTYPKRRKPAFLPMPVVIKLACVILT